jgi:hypothetical protein
MPSWRVSDPETGETLRIRGEGGPPSDDEIEVLFRERRAKRTPEEAPTGIEGAKAGLRALGENVVGAAKGAGRTVQGLGRLVNRATGISDLIMPGAIDQDLAELKPANREQELGMQAEQVAEFVVPGGAAAKAGNLARVVDAAGKAATVASAQRGDVGAETAIAGAVAGALPVVGPVAARAARKGAEKLISSALGGTKGAAQVLDEGIVALTRSGLADKVSARAAQALAAAKKAASGGTQRATVALRAAIEPVEAALEKAANVGDEALVKQLTGIRDALSNETFVAGGEAVKIARAAKLTPAEAADLGRALARYGGKQFTAAASRARAAAGRALSKGAEEAIPGLAELNARSRALGSAAGGMARAEAREAAAAASESGLEKAVRYALNTATLGALPTARSVARTTAAKTLSARELNRVSRILARFSRRGSAAGAVTRE